MYGPSLSTEIPFDTGLYFNDTSSALRFVTLATRGKSAFVFEELTNVFQFEVWVCLLIILGFGSVLIGKILPPNRHSKVCGSVTLCCKVSAGRK